MTIVDSYTNPVRTGIRFRQGKPGPEQDLIDRFIQLGTIRAPRGERLTIFREPRLPSGFPDLVVIVWKESVAKSWQVDRPNLTSVDLRLMQFLVTRGPCNLSSLKVVSNREVEKSLERLEQSAMVIRRQDAWHARTLSKTFAIRRIVAIEAKISEWKAAVDQAFVNTWFTTESYVLVPSIPKGAKLIESAQKQGVGVLSMAAPKLTEQRTDRPVSYISWLFNEWIWRLNAL